jgi:drug/metabolite transporter (DMT)-like permease
MTTLDNATVAPPITLRGLGSSAAVWGGLGVLAFSFSLPATRLAVADLHPTIVGLGRALVAAVLAAALLSLRREPAPARADVPRLLLTGVGVVIGFPMLSSLALRELSSAHATVIVGLLPAATAAFAVARGGERPGPGFWAAAAAGLAAVLAFAATQGASGLAVADLYVLGAVALCAFGYAEGATLSRRYGGWQVICWALVLTAPALVPVVAVAVALDGLEAGTDAWLGFAYVSLFSMFLGFFAWYRGLALGGIARIGQIQLGQPVLTLVWAALLLGERVTAATVAAALAVLACVGLTQRARVSRARTPPARSP